MTFYLLAIALSVCHHTVVFVFATVPLSGFVHKGHPYKTRKKLPPSSIYAFVCIGHQTPSMALLWMSVSWSEMENLYLPVASLGGGVDGRGPPWVTPFWG